MAHEVLGRQPLTDKKTVYHALVRSLNGLDEGTISQRIENDNLGSRNEQELLDFQMQVENYFENNNLRNPKNNLLLIQSLDKTVTADSDRGYSSFNRNVRLGFHLRSRKSSKSSKSSRAPRKSSKSSRAPRKSSKSSRAPRKSSKSSRSPRKSSKSSRSPRKSSKSSRSPRKSSKASRKSSKSSKASRKSSRSPRKSSRSPRKSSKSSRSRKSSKSSRSPRKSSRSSKSDLPHVICNTKKSEDDNKENLIKELRAYVKCWEKQTGRNQDLSLQRLKEESIKDIKKHLKFYRENSHKKH